MANVSISYGEDGSLTLQAEQQQLTIVPATSGNCGSKKRQPRVTGSYLTVAPPETHASPKDRKRWLVDQAPRLKEAVKHLGPDAQDLIIHMRPGDSLDAQTIQKLQGSGLKLTILLEP